MATERLSMRKTREVLRLKLELRRSHREIARTLGMGVGTVSECWPEPRLPSSTGLLPRRSTTRLALPDPAYLDKELRRPGATLKLLHEKYLGQHADGYGYTPFCEAYREWCRRRQVTMRQIHRAGDKLFVDHAGQ